MISQVAASATEGGLPYWSVGYGFSRFNPDIGRGFLDGDAVWVDYSLDRFSFLHQFGIEAEARDLNFIRPTSTPLLREDIFAVGGTYTWRRFGKLRPYGKLLGGIGNADIAKSRTRRYNVSSPAVSIGGGAEYKAYRRLWVRADYEYQYFFSFFSDPVFHPANSSPLNPQGITIGVSYHLSHDHLSH